MADSNVEIPLEGSTLNGVIAGKVNEYWLERNVRFEGSVDPMMRHAIERHVQHHIDGRAIERFYRHFYDEMDGLKHKVSSRVDAFVTALFPSA